MIHFELRKRTIIHFNTIKMYCGEKCTPYVIVAIIIIMLMFIIIIIIMTIVKTIFFRNNVLVRHCASECLRIGAQRGSRRASKTVDVEQLSAGRKCEPTASRRPHRSARSPSGAQFHRTLPMSIGQYFRIFGEHFFFFNSYNLFQIYSICLFGDRINSLFPIQSWSCRIRAGKILEKVTTKLIIAIYGRIARCVSESRDSHASEL